eukprot:7559705-Pyramimonas_sp.AAC.1
MSGRGRGTVEAPVRNIIVDERVPGAARGSTESSEASDIEAAEVHGVVLEEQGGAHSNVASHAARAEMESEERPKYDLKLKANITSVNVEGPGPF